MLQRLLPEIQKEKFEFVGSESFLDFKEAYVTVMQLMMDKKLYTDFVVLHRMRVSCVHVYSVWEGAGDFMKERGYPIHAFMMYVGVSLMRMETRPHDKSNGITLKKANELALQINSSDNRQLAVYAFHDVWKNWTLGNATKISLFLQALLNKAVSTYFINNGLCFNTAMDCEILYLNLIFNLGFFNNNKEWLICNILNLFLNALESRRLKQAKHLLQVARTIMTRCDATQERYNLLYELYQLCKSAYWAIKMATNENDMSKRFVSFTSVGLNIIDTAQTNVSLILNEDDYEEVYQKIRHLSDILTFASNKEISNTFMEILRTCRDHNGFQRI